MLIEDDKKLCSIIKSYFEEHGYHVIVTEDFHMVYEAFEKFRPELVLLDVNIPCNDGFYLCKQIRRNYKTPIIIISARGGVMEQVFGMELGADDYVIKPFQLEVLLAKVTALMRRVYGELYIEETKTLGIGRLSLDLNRFRMRYGSEEIDLSKNELILLKRFIEQKDRIINRDQLLIELWDDTQFIDDNTLTVNITRLKNKLQELGLKEVIKTKRGIGYYLDTKELLGEKDEE
jgi:DNA-binding response OmpR family regulator